MSEERLGFSCEAQVANKGEGSKVQFTQAGLLSSFPIEDFARSLSDVNLREILSGIRPLKQKRVQTRKIEEKNNMPIELLVFKLYWVNKKSIAETAQEIGINEGYVAGALKRTGIPTRDRKTASGIVWGDLGRKEKIAAKIHTPESTAMRSKSLIEWHEKQSDVTSKMQNDIAEVRRKMLAQQEHEALGLYPSFALFQYHYIDGYSVKEISEKTGLPESRLRGLMKKYGVKDLDKPYKKKGKHLVDVNKLIDIYYKKEARLNPNQENVIYKRYIEPEYHFPTHGKIGIELGITGERVRKIEDRAAKKLFLANIAKEQSQNE